MWTCPDCGRTFKRTNQSHYCGKPPVSVDEYISRQKKEIQPLLLELRDIIRNAEPQAKESIAWSTPAWKKEGKTLRISVNRNYIGIYVPEDIISSFSERLETGKGVIKLKTDEELPVFLITEVVQQYFA